MGRLPSDPSLGDAAVPLGPLPPVLSGSDAAVPLLGPSPSSPGGGDAAVSLVVQPQSSPGGGDAAADPDTAAKWPWKLAARHVHFLKKDGSGHFLWSCPHAGRANIMSYRMVIT